MKNAINYNYNLIPKAIHQKDKNCYFNTDEGNYALLPYENLPNINEIYELANSLIMQGLYVHQLIPNNNKALVTSINSENYILIKIFVEKKAISLNDIITFNSLYIKDKTGKLTQPSWYDLWTNKIDYFEYQMNQIGKKYPLLVESFSYYIGLAENAIELVSLVKKDNSYTLNHRRITCLDDTYTLYNPLNLVIDVRVRDICDYFKSCFFIKKDIIFEVEQYLMGANLNDNEKISFMARMLFPTYYFDIYEKIITDQIEENEIKKITNKVNEYEQFLRTIYFNLNKNNDIPEIEWLKKVIQY